MRHLMPALLAMCSSAACVQAADSCGTPRNAFDQVYCASGIYAQADRDLNQEYGRLHQQLDAGEYAALKSGQLAWIRQRDAQCSITQGGRFFVNLQCATALTRERLGFLQERERECLSTGCADAKLGQ